MLDHWMLADHFSQVHFQQTLLHLVPGSYCADIIQYGGRLLEMHVFLNFQDKTNACEVHVVFVLPHGSLLVDRFWKISVGFNELARPKVKCQVLVVVKSPDSVRASWLKTILGLD